MTKYLGVVLATVLLSFSPCETRAAFLAPGTTVTPDAVLASTIHINGGILASLTSPLSVAGLWSATVHSITFKDLDSGHLDFMYQVHNNATSTDALSRVVISSFGNFSTDVFYVDPSDPTSFDGSANGSVIAVRADRSADGKGVGFTFPEIPNHLNPGQTSVWMLVRTNADAWSFGRSTLQDTQSANGDALAPAPEPSSIVMLCSGMLGLAVIRAWRRRAKSGLIPIA